MNDREILKLALDRDVRIGENESFRVLVAEVKRLRERLLQFHRYAVEDPSKVSEAEATELEGNQTAENTMAINILNRAGALKERNQQLRETRSERNTLKAEVEALTTWRGSVLTWMDARPAVPVLGSQEGGSS